MEVLKKQHLKLIALISLIIPIGVFAQTSKVETLKNQYLHTEEVNFRLTNNFSGKLYYYVKLEKYNFIGNDYYEYSRDVFAENNHPSELTLCIEKDSSLILSFFIKESIFFYIIDERCKNCHSNEKENEKKGVFRLKVQFGIDEWNKNSCIYSDDFILK
jgi:hypothetical protein